MKKNIIIGLMLIALAMLAYLIYILMGISGEVMTIAETLSGADIEFLFEK